MTRLTTGPRPSRQPGDDRFDAPFREFCRPALWRPLVLRNRSPPIEPSSDEKSRGDGSNRRGIVREPARPSARWRRSRRAYAWRRCRPPGPRPEWAGMDRNAAAERRRPSYGGRHAWPIRSPSTSNLRAAYKPNSVIPASIAAAISVPAGLFRQDVLRPASPLNRPGPRRIDAKTKKKKKKFSVPRRRLMQAKKLGHGPSTGRRRDIEAGPTPLAFAPFFETSPTEGVSGRFASKAFFRLYGIGKNRKDAVETKSLEQCSGLRLNRFALTPRAKVRSQIPLPTKARGHVVRKPRRSFVLRIQEQNSKSSTFRRA